MDTPDQAELTAEEVLVTPSALYAAPGNLEALTLWYRATLETVRDVTSPDLSARQMAILMSVYMDAPPHTVKQLAAHLNISKPAVCRALDTLSAHDLVQRRVDENDRRLIHVEKTEAGIVYLSRLSSNILNKLGEI